MTTPLAPPPLCLSASPRRRAAAFLFTLFAVVAALWAAPAAAADEFLDPLDAFKASVRAADARTVEVTFEVAPGYYLYDEQFAVVFDAIKQLIAEDEARKVQPKRRIGFT